MTETFTGRSETPRVWTWYLICFLYWDIFCFNGQNYLFNVSKTLILLKIKPEHLIINKFPQNNTLASHTSYLTQW